MIVVIFELEPKSGRVPAYFDIAAKLRPLLDGIDGFISIERYESLTTQGKYLSLSFWQNEEAVKAWRNLQPHRSAQGRGRSKIFQNYRLRVASVDRDYGLNDRNQAPRDSKAVHGNPV